MPLLFKIFTGITLCLSAMKQTKETQTNKQKHTHTKHCLSQFQVILHHLTNGYTTALNKWLYYST